MSTRNSWLRDWLIGSSILLLCWQNLPSLDGSPCSQDYAGACTLKQVTVNASQGMPRFVEAIPNPRQPVIIERVRLSANVSMLRVLELFGTLFDKITFQNYHEPNLPVSERFSYSSLSLDHAGKLRHLLLTPNKRLNRLYIANSAIESIPKSMANLRALQVLALDKSRLRVLDLGLLCSLPSLRRVQLVENHISLLIAAPANCSSRLQYLDLKKNRLTSLDMVILAPFGELHLLALMENAMKQFGSSRRLQFPNLESLELSRNNLSFFTLDQLHLPACRAISLGENRLETLPILSGRDVPKLEVFHLHGNRLSELDLAQLEALPSLIIFDVSSNKLTSLVISRPIQLPSLKILTLSENYLQSIPVLLRSSFPNLSSIGLSQNSLDRVPIDLLEFASVRLLDLRNNPLLCSSLEQHKALLQQPLPSLQVTLASNCAVFNLDGFKLSTVNYACCVK